MAVTVGSRLGPYELLAPLAAGGMGEVFKARDTRLGRDVAIKVLPSEFARNEQLKLRFEREARIISRLNDPHICTVHDIGDADGTSYLVMEYLDGETLADRIARGPLPLRDVLRFGVEIAKALARAHGAGVVHRDLKPANIVITASGAKLLDFGLAQSMYAGSPTDATEQKPLTGEGMIAGTLQYMAPEQLAGEEADARADIFALGAVLYEMLTGVRAFQGTTRTSLITAIVASEPRPPSQRQPLTPAALEHVIMSCLEKERLARWQSAADVASELEWISRAPSASPAGVSATQRAPRAGVLAVALSLVTVVAVVAIAAAVWFERRMTVAERPLRTELMLPTGEQASFITAGGIALSPDGTQLAIVVGPRGRNIIAVRNLASGDMRKLIGTERASYPFWSSDGSQIGFFADRKLKTIPANGGPVQILCDAPQGRGGAWSRRGVIVFTPEILAPLFKVSEAGGSPVAVTRAGARWTNRNPVFLPDGRTFLYIARDIGGMAAGDLYAGSTDGTLQKRIMTAASNAAWAGGRLFFARGGDLFAQPFDTRTLSLTGTPVAIAGHVDYYNVRDFANFSVAANRIVYASTTTPLMQVVVYDASGRQIATPGPPGGYHLLDLSADGRKLLLSISKGSTGDVWTMDIARGILSRITFFDTPPEALTAVFSPDGKRIASSHSGPNGRYSVVVHSLDGSATDTILDSSVATQVREWSRDGKYLIAQVQNNETLHDIAYIDVQQKKLAYALRTPADEMMPSLSPNGKWLAYLSTESGTAQVYVTRFPSGEGKWQMTTDGGADPRWSPDGTRLFFMFDGRLHAVDVHDGPTPQAGMPVELPIAPADPDSSSLGIGYGTAADGRVIALKQLGETPPNPLHLITNWAKLLPR